LAKWKFYAKVCENFLQTISKSLSGAVEARKTAPGLGFIGEDDMKISRLHGYASAIALCTALVAAPAFAQDEAVSADEEVSRLDEIVVTASGRDQTKIETSVSVTSIDAQLIQDFQPSSEAEVFKLIPGIQVPGTSGPGGNSNIAVRGLPVATGGAPFVQLQEDGLPVVLFGDIQFGNNDYWTRFDPSVATIEAVRGGSATTFASQAPGAVINYISNYGREEGGYVELKKGIDYSETQLNFRYGGSLTDSMNFHVGGAFKRGRGPLNAGYNLSDSIQVKANVTMEKAISACCSNMPIQQSQTTPAHQRSPQSAAAKLAM
jgi:outer membrane cobalamin receptor